MAVESPLIIVHTSILARSPSLCWNKACWNSSHLFATVSLCSRALLTRAARGDAGGGDISCASIWRRRSSVCFRISALCCSKRQATVSLCSRACMPLAAAARADGGATEPSIFCVGLLHMRFPSVGGGVDASAVSFWRSSCSWATACSRTPRRRCATLSLWRLTFARSCASPASRAASVRRKESSRRRCRSSVAAARCVRQLPTFSCTRKQ
mmetsp:Transcript_61693/g.177593  ORF Transcript_61693/g.177593 Transcript_61693/m.177593 type:complete len:211 (+) Transcript_61693:1838-2470(+)